MKECGHASSHHDQDHAQASHQFVREQVQLVCELEDTPFHPGGSVFDDFIRGLKPDVQTFVQDHAPSGWWIEIKDLYQSALDFEMNGIASNRARARGAEQVDELGSISDNDSEQVDDDLLEHDPDHDDWKRVRTPSPVWEARKDPKKDLNSCKKNFTSRRSETSCCKQLAITCKPLA